MMPCPDELARAADMINQGEKSPFLPVTAAVGRVTSYCSWLKN